MPDHMYFRRARDQPTEPYAEHGLYYAGGTCTNDCIFESYSRVYFLKERNDVLGCGRQETSSSQESREVSLLILTH